jgi:copper transport protein
VTRRRRARALCAVALLTIAWLVVGDVTARQSAGAHAVIDEASPSDGELLDKSPAEVAITFTEPPDPELSTLRVLDSTGGSVTTGATEVDPKARAMSVAVEDLADGVYTVAWRAVSQTDGHVTSGSYSFGVGVEPPAGSGSKGDVVTSRPSVLSVVARSSLYWGLSLLLAAGTLGAWMLSPVGLPRALVGAAWALASAGICLMVVAQADAVGVSTASMLGTATGRPLVQQAICIAIAGAGTLLFVLGRARPGLWIASAGAAAAMLFHAGAGHAGASQSWRWFDVGLQWVHVLATGLWIGGLVWLLLSIRRLDGDARTRAIARFSFLAGLNLAVIVGTGVAREIDELGGWGNLDALFHTSFGKALLVKTALFVGLVAFAARNRWRDVPRLQSDPGAPQSVARTVTAELFVALAVLGTTGVLSQLPPPASAKEGREQQQRVVVTGNDFATTVKARLSITPGTVGANRFSVALADFDTGEPVDARRVELDFSFSDRPELASTLELEHKGDVWTADGTQLSLNGTWEVDVLVESIATSVEIPLEVRTRRPPQDIEVSEQEGQPTLYTIQLGGGNTVQTYVDPGKAGPNNVHVTFFDSAGAEFPVEGLTVTATSQSGDVVELETRKFSAGHYVSSAELDAGRWEFDFSGRSDAGAVSPYFTHTIEP